MSEVRNAILTINYMDGSVQKYSFTKKEDGAMAMARIKDALAQNQILLALDDRAVIIPLTAVKFIEVYPRPSKMPPNAIENVNLMTSA
jgi:hypothetical protein